LKVKGIVEAASLWIYFRKSKLCFGLKRRWYPRPVSSSSTSAKLNEERRLAGANPISTRCLADRLRSAEHPLHALAMYQEERLPMTAQIVRMNRKGGPEGVIDAVEERAPDGFASIDDVLSFEERKAIVRGYASTAGYARDQVNKAA